MKICSHLRRCPSVLAFIRAKYPAKHIFAEYKSELENTHRNCTRTHSFSHSEARAWAQRFNFTMCFLCKAPTLSFAIVSHGFYVWYLLHDMNFVRMCVCAARIERNIHHHSDSNHIWNEITIVVMVTLREYIKILRIALFAFCPFASSECIISFRLIKSR